MPRSKMFVSAMLLVLLAGPGTSMAAEPKDGKPGAEAQAGEEAPACYKKFGVKGHSNKLQTIARIAAVRAWSNKAMQYGEEYTIWHNAQSQNIKCRKLQQSQYFLCFASAKPCRAANSGKTASNKTN